MPFIDKSNTGIIPQLLGAILNDCVNGITLANPDLEDCPIVYANKVFERLTGYSQEEIIGRNCRFLQGQDTDQPTKINIKEALEKREVIEVTLRNYKKDGTLFYNHLKITPLFNSQGRLLYFLGLQYDISYQLNAEIEIKKLSDLLKQ
jgi:PAS domain S-box-containing protein